MLALPPRGKAGMGEAASVLRALSCQDCARYVCNDASIHSQCCDEEDGCNCDVQTHETKVEPAGEDIEVSVGNEFEGLCCNCLFKHHK